MSRRCSNRRSPGTAVRLTPYWSANARSDGRRSPGGRSRSAIDRWIRPATCSLSRPPRSVSPTAVVASSPISPVLALRVAIAAPSPSRRRPRWATSGHPGSRLDLPAGSDYTGHTSHTNTIPGARRRQWGPAAGVGVIEGLRRPDAPPSRGGLALALPRIGFIGCGPFSTGALYPPLQHLAHGLIPDPSLERAVRGDRPARRRSPPSRPARRAGWPSWSPAAT